MSERRAARDDHESEKVEPTPNGPAGYRRTEVGVIPEDWQIDRIDQHAIIKTGSKNTKDKQDGGEYPFFVRSQKVERIGTYSYDGEAVLTAGDGVRTGKVFHYIRGRFDAHQRVYRISDFSDRLNGRYFFFQFSKSFYHRIMSMTAKSSVDSVRMEMIAGMRIPLPPHREQCAIATVLSDVDELIGSAEALISKKRAIRQATMQQLLTGRTRLPGFAGAWDTVTLRDIADIRNGGTPRTGGPSYWGGSIPWCVPTDITTCRGKYLVTTKRHITPEGLTSCGTSLLPSGSLLLCMRATIGEIKIAAIPVATNQGCKSLICRELIDYVFLYFRLLSLKNQLVSLATGSTFLEISKRGVANICIDVPSLPEQRAIATVLSDMDAEIAALERRLDKTRAVKAGMVQQLLTGSIRLPVPDDFREGDTHGT